MTTVNDIHESIELFAAYCGLAAPVDPQTEADALDAAHEFGSLLAQATGQGSAVDRPATLAGAVDLLRYLEPQALGAQYPLNQLRDALARFDTAIDKFRRARPQP